MVAIISLDPHSKSFCALLECSFPTFQNLANLSSNRRILTSPTLVGKLGKIAGAMRATFSNDHLVRIRVHNEIGVMRNDDDLPAQSCCLETLHEVFVDGFGIEVFLRLVDYQWPVVVRIYRNVE